MANLLISVGIVAVAAIAVLFFLSFDTLEYQEMGLNYSWLKESVQKRPYGAGRYYLGIGNYFLKFPKMVQSVYFIEDGSGWQSGSGSVYAGSAHNSLDLRAYTGPALQSRTSDGLNVRLEVSFQYKLNFTELYDLFATLGTDYEHTFVRMAIEQITISATKHPAHFFFTNRTTISMEMHKEIDDHFKANAFASVPFFQLRTVHLPSNFEDAIRMTQVKQQEIQIATLEQKTNRVTFETKVLQAEQAVNVMMNEAYAEVAAIKAQNEAYCLQYQYTQNMTVTALAGLMGQSGWNSGQLLEFLRIRAVRDHPSEKTTMRL